METPPAAAESLQTALPPASDSPWLDAQWIGSLHHRFALLETPEGLVILDPRAARERILYEQARSEMTQRESSSQPLLLPVTFTCTPLQARLLIRHRDAFQALGFSLEPFGEDTFIVEALPGWMEHADPEETVRQLAEELEACSNTQTAPEQRRDQLARSCCRIAAAKRSLPSPEEIRWLLQELGQCQMPYTTPFGRPTLIHMSTGELRRKFGLS
jgi:DNA mismatch repair protein MutL